MKLGETVTAFLRCPKCRGELRPEFEKMRCMSDGCSKEYPVVEGIPVLIDEENSLFSMEQFLEFSPTTFDPGSFQRSESLLSRITPRISNNLSSVRDLRRFKDLVMQSNPAPRILVLGGGIITIGTEALLDPRITLVESDVAHAPRTQIIIDGHSIPFADGTFDGVVMQAMLEHVVDPYRVVSEAHRVLNATGYVYASVPFMQQVHMAQYDFTRFTHLGLRRLFRCFEEIDMGAFAGTGVALSWAVNSFLASLSDHRKARRLLEVAGAFATFWLKYVDYLTRAKKGTFDGASGYYFLGKKSWEVLADRELIKGYRGAG